MLKLISPRILIARLADSVSPDAMLLKAVLTGLAYYGTAKLGVTASIMSEGISIFWAPNAILLSALFLSKPRHWPYYTLAIIPAEIAADLPTFTLEQALLFAGTNILETIVAASLFRMTIGDQPVELDSLRKVWLFLLYALVIASGGAGLLGAAIYQATALNPPSFLSNWRIWWVGDALGLLMITPAILGWLQEPSNGWNGSPRQCYLEAFLLTGATVGLGFWIFSTPKTSSTEHPLSPILMFPLTIWAAAHFGIRGTATINLLITAISIVGTMTQKGPFVSMHQADNVFRLQEFLGGLAFSSLAIAALLQELRSQNQQLKVFERAIHAVNDGILITDAKCQDNPIVYANRGFETITGYRIEAIKGRNPRFLQTDSVSEELSKVRTAIAQRQQVRALIRNRRHDGSEFWNQMSIDPVRDEKGEVSHFIGVQHDITELIETENALRSARDELARINHELEQRIEERTEALRQANEKLAELAATDSLTGIYNRRHFMVCANEEFARAIRYNRALALLAIDIDHFKQINDDYGHAAGDNALKELTKTVQQTLRAADLFARFGGEEFCVLLPETALDEAANMAERLRAKAAALGVSNGRGGDLKFTISIGVAIRQSYETEVDSLLNRADHALYHAKARGRNRVSVAEQRLSDYA